MTGFQGNSIALFLQVPVPAPTVSPCKAIDPNCVDCANNVCTACNIIFTLDDATKKCGEPLPMPCAHCNSDLAAACHSIVIQLTTVAASRLCAVHSPACLSSCTAVVNGGDTLWPIQTNWKCTPESHPGKALLGMFSLAVRQSTWQPQDLALALT